MPEKIRLNERELRARLTPEQYHVLREHGTEPAFANRYWDEKRRGTYVCGACALPLFRSGTKYDSGTGWPSFWQPIAADAVETEPDDSYGMTRTAIVCARCGSHLGHVFEDGPPPTGLRYCMNSAALQFKEEE